MSTKHVPDRGALRCTGPHCRFKGEPTPLDWTEDRARAARSGQAILCEVCTEIFMLRTRARAHLGSDVEPGEQLDDLPFSAIDCKSLGDAAKRVGDEFDKANVAYGCYAVEDIAMGEFMAIDLKTGAAYRVRKHNAWGNE